MVTLKITMPEGLDNVTRLFQSIMVNIQADTVLQFYIVDDSVFISLADINQAAIAGSRLIAEVPTIPKIVLNKTFKV